MSQTLLSNFEINRKGANLDQISGRLPNADAVVGKPMMVSAVDADTGDRTFAVANAGFAGWLTRAVTENVGPSYEAQLFPGSELETPFTRAGLGTIELADEVIVEGADYIKQSAGTGQITTSAPAGSELTFTAGVLTLAQDEEEVFFKLVKQLTPNTNGNTRILIKAVSSYFKPASGS